MIRRFTNKFALLQALEDVERQDIATEMDPEKVAALTLYYRARLALKEREAIGATLH